MRSEWMLILCGVLNTLLCSGQTEIPIGSWRMHLSYNKIIAVAVGNDEVFAATENGVLIFNRTDNSIATYNKLNGLTSSGITSLAFDEASDQLLVAYADGNLDIVKSNIVTNFARLRNLESLNTSKKIYHITIEQGLAYFSTDFGVVVFDLSRHEIKETWRDLGQDGTPLKIFQSYIAHDSVLLATEKGLLSGLLNKNLLDFNQWQRYDTGELSVPIQAVSKFNGRIYAAIDNVGIYEFNNGNFVLSPLLQKADFHSVNTSPDHLLIATASGAWLLNKSGQLAQIADDQIVSPVVIKEETSNIFWIADEKNGLVSNISGDFNSILPNGPTFSEAFRLVYINQAMYAIPGGRNASGNGPANYFLNGQWATLSNSQHDLTDVEFFNNSLYTSTNGNGLFRYDAEGSITQFDQTNSPLTGAGSIKISALEKSEDGLWVLNYDADQPLRVLKIDNTWQSFNVAAAERSTDVAIDLSGNAWLVIDPEYGGGLAVVDPLTGNITYRSNVAGNGGLPNTSVRSIAVDRDGYVWIGTDLGVAYLFSEREDAIKPIFENRFLLRDEKITAIEVDGGNRKWLGTETGVWLFNPTGEELIHRFTAENSPLLSNVIRDIEINDETGEVFFATDKGIVSFRGDATTSEATFRSVKIFPNPVTPEFSGVVGISGLATDAIIKITDVSGKLIWETQANGGSATWNLKDYKGRHASTGMYLVFAVTADGRESVVGKLAVIE